MFLGGYWPAVRPAPKSQPFLVGVDHWDAFNSVYANYFGDWRPTGTIGPVPAL